jgi:GGDEF domain-containing protein
MTDAEQLSALHTAVTSYLSALLAIADCVGTACPEVGGPYRHRLSRLRSRLAFDTNPAAIVESNATVEKELAEFARKSASYVAQHGMELQRTIGALETIVKSLAQRQEFYGARLRQFAAQMETTAYPTEPEHLSEVVALQAAGLLGCVESMHNDSQSLVARMRDELAATATRLEDAEVTDRLTGLMNRKEMERQIAQCRAAGEEPVLVVFELSGDVSDEVSRQAGARLGSQFRYKDLVCRWTEYEYMVMFQGNKEIAQARTEQIVPWIAGKYPLDSGEILEIRVEAGLVEPNLLAMQ